MLQPSVAESLKFKDSAQQLQQITVAKDNYSLSIPASWIKTETTSKQSMISFEAKSPDQNTHVMVMTLKPQSLTATDILNKIDGSHGRKNLQKIPSGDNSIAKGTYRIQQDGKKTFVIQTVLLIKYRERVYYLTHTQAEGQKVSFSADDYFKHFKPIP
ncbi:MAG: hypothetical protein LW875_06235 [Proteobacteria bacterium]|nr:hypothetical protein [Pseudomonadota bacterium]